MRTRSTFVVIMLLLMVPLAGCNAVYLRETEKFGLTIEGKPDATQPVSGSFAYKQRVSLVVPGTKKQDTAATDKDVDLSKKSMEGADAAIAEAANRAAGEAVSVISFYDFSKTPSTPPKPFADPIEIRTAFITGDAAIALNTGQTGQAAAAITATDIPSWDQLADLAINNANSAGQLERLKNLVRKSWDETKSTDATMRDLRNVTGDASYGPDLHDAIRRKLKV